MGHSAQHRPGGGTNAEVKQHRTRNAGIKCHILSGEELRKIAAAPVHPSNHYHYRPYLNSCSRRSDVCVYGSAMTEDVIRRIWKQMEEAVNPKWQRDLVKMWEPQVRLNSALTERIHASLKTQRLVEQQNAIFQTAASNAVLNAGQAPTFMKLQAQVQQIARSIPVPDVQIPSAYSAWSAALLQQQSVMDAVAGILSKATGLTQSGGLTRAIGPKASAFAGLRGYTKADAEGITHVSEDVSLDLVKEAKKSLLEEPDRLQVASSVDLDESDVQNLEAFLLPTDAARAAYEAATREIVFESLDSIDYIGAKAAVLASIFALLFALCLSGPSDKPLGAGDYIGAAANSAGVTSVMGVSESYIRRRVENAETIRQ